MCMKNQFCTFGRYATRIFYVMAFCGLVWACKDEYTLDDEKPEWLSENLYSLLENRGNFTNYLNLLEDKAVNTEGARTLKEVLSKTGSKTVFAASDESWNQFYQRNAKLPASNPWHNATSYDRLSTAQKRLLIHSSMLNNAIVMENLSASDGSGSNPPTPGQYMRRYTDVDVIDSVTFLPSEEVPYTYNPKDSNYWKPYRPVADGGNGRGIYLVTDATRNMMVHFTREHMGRSDIMVTDDDFEKVMGETRKTDDVHVYDARLLEKDGVAENGYLNVVERVVVPLNNMAEIIRTNGSTNIFSHMLERFSYPMPNTELTEAYKNLHPEFNGMVYTKKYFAQRGAGGESQTNIPDSKLPFPGTALKYDPGWNEFSAETTDAREDMGTMFVPNDKALFQYFSKGGAGWQLVDTYAPYPDAPVTEGDWDALYKKIDYIPLTTLGQLLNVIMFNSFTGSVPSKIQTLRDYTSQEEMFTPADADMIDTCLIANNGVVYVMNKVYGPASFTSVAGPANICKDTLEQGSRKIMQWAINNGSDYNHDKMHMNYFAYLMAMRSWFTFFLPNDMALTRYYDPVSFTSKQPRIIKMEILDESSDMPLNTGKVLYEYDPKTGLINWDKQYKSATFTEYELLNRLRDVLESHTIVHTDGVHMDENDDEYYVAKNGSAIKVEKTLDPATGKYRVVKVQGGFQLENERAGITAGSPGTTELNVPLDNYNEMANGHTMILDEAPIIPASKSIYYITHQDPTFAPKCTAFQELTNFRDNDSILIACGLVKSKNDKTGLAKYSVWSEAGAVDKNVKFLSSYNYTVFVPTDGAIAAAEALGLPTWNDIKADYYSLPEDPEDSDKHILNGADSLRLQAKITYLNNFLRCHFVDGSIFEDKSTTDVKECQTSSYDSKNMVFVKVHVQREKVGGMTRLTVRDDQGGNKLMTTGDLTNIMTRDMHCILETKETGFGTGVGKDITPTNRNTLNNIILQYSSFAVIHQIDGVLCHKSLVGGRYDSDWATPSACKRYLERYAITDKTTR